MRSIILASGSPRRKEILEQAGINFEVVPSQVNEISTKINPSDIVKELSMEKARDVARSRGAGEIIIGADTIVVVNGRVLGKPKDEQDAKRMIRMLQGTKHQVYTGVTILIKSGTMHYSETSVKDKTIQFVETTNVSVYPMTEAMIEQYVATKESMDKAGAYAIQGRFSCHIKGIEGDYFNVVGLPVSKIVHVLKEQGIQVF